MKEEHPIVAKLFAYLRDFLLAPRKGLWLALVWMGARDQQPLRHFDRISAAWSTDRAAWQRAMVQLAWRRDRHARRLAAIITRVGWPGFAIAGRYGALAAFLIAQHADHDPAFQERALAAMQAAFAQGGVEPRHVAYLIDHVRLAQGLPQVYGSQFRHGAPRALEDPERVDERRATMGLEPLAIYGAKMRAQFPHLHQPGSTPEEIAHAYLDLRERLPPGYAQGMVQALRHSGERL